MIVQMVGIITSQALLNIPDPSGFVLFILPSVLVSLAFMPILLAATPAPVFDTIKPLAFGRLFRISPLGCAGMLLTGGIFAAMFGMAAVWGAMIGLSVQQITDLHRARCIWAGWCSSIPSAGRRTGWTAAS